MHLSEEAKKDLYLAYGNMSEELYILYRCLLMEGFANEEAIQIVCSIISQPSVIRKRRRIDRENLKQFIKKEEV